VSLNILGWNLSHFLTESISTGGFWKLTTGNITTAETIEFIGCQPKIKDYFKIRSFVILV
jgi:hypothetical protein